MTKNEIESQISYLYIQWQEAEEHGMFRTAEAILIKIDILRILQKMSKTE